MAGRFKRIAGDLEKLPCELHEGVLADLEFEQIIRLSQFAGPRLTWSLGNSPSAWGKFFLDGNWTELQKLLSITDQVKKRCFKLPKSKDHRPYVFAYGSLSFLGRQDSHWAKHIRHPYSQHTSAYYGGPLDRVSLSAYWLKELNKLVIEKTWQVFHKDYPKLIEPWISHLDCGLSYEQDRHPPKVFEKILLFANQNVTVMRNKYTTQPPLSLDELAQFVDLYQQVRLTRAAALAGELYRLADLYESHPTRLKMPFAPQTRHLNLHHIPANMRFKARKLVRRTEETRWNKKITSQSHFAYPFPALVPYDWCMQLFVTVLQTYVLLESIYPKVMIEKCKVILEGPPRWATVDLPTQVKTGLANLPISKAFDQLARDSEIPIPEVPIRTQLNAEMKGDAYRPHADIELKWLEVFTDVIAWMEESFPDVLRQVRPKGDGWD